ncbi:hypothetical protein CNQ87_13295 [Lysinibacillus fusiformis]|nr:hypothetical protein CNQ87_13295 [Lysinibacillus fusiformis]
MLTENEIKEIIEDNYEILRAKVIACRENANIKIKSADAISSDETSLTINEEVELELDDDED